MCKFALQPYQLGLLGLGQADVGLGEDGDHVAGLEFEVLRRIVVEDQLAEVEGDQLGF